MPRINSQKEFQENKDRFRNAEIDRHLARMSVIDKHKLDNCRTNNHYWEGGATGGRDGHASWHCPFCGERTEGWD